MDDPKDGTQETQPQNEAPTPDEFAAIKAQLGEAQQANTTLKELLDNKDATIADLEVKRGELESSLSEAKQSSEAVAATLKEARDQAIAKYLTMVKALNPTVPEAMISGETIEGIDASIEKGKALVASVKASLESEASAAKVPA